MLAPEAASFDLELPAGNKPMSEARASFGSDLLEIEIVEMEKPAMAAGALNIETQIVPETSQFPALAVGVRDIGNNTYGYAASGYFGRGFYAVGGRAPIQFAAANYPLKNLAYTLGCGVCGIAGPFGSASADLPLRLRWTLEWDSRNLNESLALRLTNYASLQYERQASDNFFGLAVYTPVNVF